MGYVVFTHDVFPSDIVKTNNACAEHRSPLTLSSSKHVLSVTKGVTAHC